MMRYTAALAARAHRAAPSAWANRRGLVAAVLLFLSACAGHREAAQPPATEALPPLATRLFTVAYNQIEDRYVQTVSLATVISAGVGNLSKLDARFAAVRQGDRIELREDGAIVETVELPVRDGDPRRWAMATVSALDKARLHSQALRATTPENLYQVVFDGALATLDPYSRYAGQEAARESRANRDGFGGIGITIDTEHGDVRVATVLPGSPAARSGVIVDDRITHVDGGSLKGVGQRDVVRLLRGPIGRPVDVTIQRPGRGDPIVISITRTLIVPPTVTYRREGNIAYIKLSGFNHRTTDMLSNQVKAAIAEIGPDLEGMILDLRGNLGGLLDQAISVADLFLPNGQIVSTRGRHRASAQSSDASPGDIGESVPLVVLVNGSSASASEIVAAALQDNSRAVVIGTTSFGKGSVQTVIPMPNDGELVLTWARFHAPSGYPLQDLGVIPAVCTSGGLANADEIMTEVRAGHLTDAAIMERWRAADHGDKDELKRLRAICSPETREREIDLEVARRLLADRPLYARALQSVQLAARGH